VHQDGMDNHAKAGSNNF